MKERKVYAVNVTPSSSVLHCENMTPFKPLNAFSL